MKKRIYQLSTIGVLTVIIFILSAYYDWQPAWYVLAIVFVVGLYIGKFLYVVFSGVSVMKVELMEYEDDPEIEFYADFQLGMSRAYRVHGKYDAKYEFKAKELQLLLYKQTPRDFIEKLVSKNMNINSFEYEYSGKPFRIDFTFLNY